MEKLPMCGQGLGSDLDSDRIKSLTFWKISDISISFS